jgi:hypothetical protein
MKGKKIFALALLGITAGVGVYGEEEACPGDEIAWERKELDAERYKQQGKTMKRAQKENAESNKYTFESYLSSDVYKVYDKFTHEQKLMAMDYADNHQMDPNDAVAEVVGRMKNAY